MGQGPTTHWEQGQTGAWTLFCRQSPCETVLSMAPPAPTPASGYSSFLRYGTNFWARVCLSSFSLSVNSVTSPRRS